MKDRKAAGILLGLAALGGLGGLSYEDRPMRKQFDEVDEYLKRRKRTYAEEYELIKQGKSCLSRSQRNRVKNIVESSRIELI